MNGCASLDLPFRFEELRANEVARRGASRLRLHLHVDCLRRRADVLEQRRTEPTFHLQRFRVLPLAQLTATPAPFELDLMTGERGAGEDQQEAICGVWDVRRGEVDHGVGAADEGL